MEWNITYSDGDRLRNAGVIKTKIFKSGNEGLTLSIPLSEAEKMVTMAKRERKDWVNMMAFEKKQKTKEDRKAATTRKATINREVEKELDEEMIDFDDDIPF